jgi:hypothetical protein
LSNIAVGFVLGQKDSNNKLRPAHYGSITWNNREASYSQAKLELYGVIRALHTLQAFIAGIKKLVLEIDAKYIKGMLNNPNLIDRSVINRWITHIQLYDFELQHFPKEEHKGPDGLSQRRLIEADGMDVTQEQFDKEVKKQFETFAISNSQPFKTQVQKLQTKSVFITTMGDCQMPMYPETKRAKTDLNFMRRYLTTLQWPDSVGESDHK